MKSVCIRYVMILRRLILFHKRPETKKINILDYSSLWPRKFHVKNHHLSNKIWHFLSLDIVESNEYMNRLWYTQCHFWIHSKVNCINPSAAVVLFYRFQLNNLPLPIKSTFCPGWTQFTKIQYVSVINWIRFFLHLSSNLKFAYLSNYCEVLIRDKIRLE